MYLRSAALAAGLLCLGLAAPSPAQEVKKADPKKDEVKTDVVKEEVSFKTFDGVLLKGTFYPSKKGASTWRRSSSAAWCSCR